MFPLYCKKEMFPLAKKNVGNLFFYFLLFFSSFSFDIILTLFIFAMNFQTKAILNYGTEDIHSKSALRFGVQVPA